MNLYAFRSSNIRVYLSFWPSSFMHMNKTQTPIHNTKKQNGLPLHTLEKKQGELQNSFKKQK
jgi:hypothetical protein